jgi:hypothetical protein
MSSQEQKMIVTGTLTRMMAIGGESTGWAIQLDSETSIDGKSVRTVEIDLRDSKKLGTLVNKHVRATGQLSRRTGVETGIRSVLEVSSIEETVAPSTSGRDLTQLFSHIWQVTDTLSKPAPGSIYVFLANGTLLQTSCAETYRIARWSIDKSDPSVLRVVEDGQLAFTASITELTSQTLKFRQKLARGNETRSVTLKAVEREFVCPDLPK